MAFVNDRWYTKRGPDGSKARTAAYRTNGKRWQACYVDPAGVQRAEGFATKAEAQDRLAEIATQRRTGTYIDPKRGRATVGEMADRWLATKVDATPATIERYRQILANDIRPVWGRAQVADVMPSGVASWVAMLTRQTCTKKENVLAPASVRKVVSVFSGVMDTAVLDGRIARNPCTAVKLPKVAPSQRRYLTHGELDELATRTGAPVTASKHRRKAEVEPSDQARLVVLVLGYCGLRWGELAGLRVASLDLMRRRLSVTDTAVEVGGVFHFQAPKDNKHRSVPVPTFLADELGEFVAGRAQGELLFSGARSGGPLRNRIFRRGGFDRAATALDLEGFTPHELRHTAASLAISSGANVKAVQRMLGHASAAMTLDTYADLFDDDLDAVAQGMDAARQVALSRAGTESSLNVGTVISFPDLPQTATAP